MLHEMGLTQDVHTQNANTPDARGFGAMPDSGRMDQGFSRSQDNLWINQDSGFTSMPGIGKMEPSVTFSHSNFHGNSGFAAQPQNVGSGRGINTPPESIGQGQGSNTLPGNFGPGQGINTLPANFGPGQGSNTLPANFDPRQGSNTLPANFGPGQGGSTLPANASPRQGSSTLPGNIGSGQGINTLPESIDPRQGITTLPGNVRPAPGFPFPPAWIPGGPGPVIPCPNCKPFPAQNINVRFLNASPLHSNLTVSVDNRVIMTGLEFAEVSRYRPYSSGFHRVTVTAPGGFVFLQQNIFLGNNSTITIVSSNNRLNLTTVTDGGCNTTFNTSCLRVSNMAYASGSINVTLSNRFLSFNNIRPGNTSNYSRIQSGTYSVSVARSARPAMNLLSTFINLNPNRVFTLYVLDWSPSPDAVRTLLVEDIR